MRGLFGSKQLDLFRRLFRFGEISYYCVDGGNILIIHT